MKFLTSLILSLAMIIPAPAYGLHDGNIKNSTYSSRTLTVCKDWGNTSCKSTSPRGYLSPGQNARTKYGWSDTDGYYIPSECWVRAGYVSIWGPRWVKKSGLYGITYTIRLHC